MGFQWPNRIQLKTKRLISSLSSDCIPLSAFSFPTTTSHHPWMDQIKGLSVVILLEVDKGLIPLISREWFIPWIPKTEYRPIIIVGTIFLRTSSRMSVVNRIRALYIVGGASRTLIILSAQSAREVPNAAEPSRINWIIPFNRSVRDDVNYSAFSQRIQISVRY